MIKKIVLITAVALSLSAFELEFSKEFETKVTPTTAASSLHIEVLADDEKEVTSRLERVSTYINGYRQVEKEGGNFKIHANYIYDDGKREQEGFKGYMDYKIMTKSIDDLDMFLEDLLLNKENENIEVRSYGYEVSPKDMNDKLEELRLKSIIWGINYSKALSSKIFKTCEVKNISFNQRPIQPREYGNFKTVALDARFAPKPTQHDKSLHLIPNFVMECK